ncbi:MAG: hypothetical protein H6Q19_2040 [Bacteroidetes bacterium]|nr:hypothetical protein [Bacteroidota bacterium]
MPRKRIIVLIFAVAVYFISAPAAPKQVYITVDNSGSMTGDKYMVSAYTAQLITLLNAGNDVTVIMNGVARKIPDTPEDIKSLRIAQPNVKREWGSSSFGSQIGDIASFNELFKKNSGRDQWLFVIGDGNWNTNRFPAITANFLNLVSDNPLRIFFVPYGSNEYYPGDFTSIIRKVRNARILNGATSFSNVFNNCIVLIYYLTSTECKLPTTNLVDEQTVEVNSVVPAKKYLIFYQDNRNENELPEITATILDTVTMKAELLGKPSTFGMQFKNYPNLLSSALWKVENKSRIQSGKPLILKFDRKIEQNKLKVFVFPDETFYTKTDSIIQISSKSDKLVKTGASLASIIVVDKNELAKALEKTVYNTKSVESSNADKYSNDKFRSKIQSLKPKSLVIPAPPLTPVTFRKIADGKPRTGYLLHIPHSSIFDPEKHEIAFDPGLRILFKDISTWSDSENTVFLLESRNQLTSLFIPDTLKLNLKIISKVSENTSYADNDRIIIRTATVKDKIPVAKLIIRLFSCLLLIIYLLLLSRKARFKKGAIISYRSVDESDLSINITLRKKGITNWLNRWLNPFIPENSEIVFAKMDTKIRFTACRKKTAVRIHKSFLDNRHLYFDHYAWKVRNYAELTEDNKLIIKTNNSDTGKPAVITYNRMKNVRDDVPVFRFLLFLSGIILMAVLILI